MAETVAATHLHVIEEYGGCVVPNRRPLCYCSLLKSTVYRYSLQTDQKAIFDNVNALDIYVFTFGIVRTVLPHNRVTNI